MNSTNNEQIAQQNNRKKLDKLISRPLWSRLGNGKDTRAVELLKLKFQRAQSQVFQIECVSY